MTAQTLGNATVTAGGSAITMVDGGGSGQTNTLNLGTITSTSAGGSLLVTSPANTAVKFNQALNTDTTVNSRIVFYDGTSYNWAANTGANTATVGFSAYNAQAGNTISNATSDTKNSSVSSATASQLIPSGSAQFNALIRAWYREYNLARSRCAGDPNRVNSINCSG